MPLVSGHKSAAKEIGEGDCNTLKFWILKKIGKYDFIQFCDNANLE
jgi:hypothetical protein